jgi:hypothetical protein
LEIPSVASCVVAEIYRGIEFPSDWINKPDVLNLGMARDLLVSVAAMFDGDLKPIALCWRIDGRDERFVHAQPNDPDGSSLLDELHVIWPMRAYAWVQPTCWRPCSGRPTNFGPTRASQFTRSFSHEVNLVTAR